ncbi:MAG TPA: Gfo/Idh/MocA family oxidoreductase, partial [Fimbriimonas sp.]|nr:Gfo/Idh/MocA family oxidoreductase [Fimbriimonas sp.]
AWKAIAAGKHTFIEKPIEVSYSTALPILDAAEKADVVVTVGHVLRYFGMYRKAHDVVKSGQLGKPAAVRMSRTGIMPGGVNNWFGDHSLSGGVFIDLAVHDFDWLLWTLGPAKSVFAKSIGATTGQGKDYGLATIEFEIGALAHVEASWMETEAGRTAFEVCGSEGMLEYDSRNVPTLRQGNSLEQHHLPDDDPFYLQLLNFVRAAQGESAQAVTVREACEALRLAEAALESAKTGQLVNL